MDEAIAIFVGVGLAAACGFRVFVPLFIASLAANPGVDLGFLGSLDFQELVGENAAWIGSTPVTVALGVATVVEVAAYYIPWVDNLLDSVATPAAVGAGTLISGLLMPDLLGDGSLKWLLALIAGGGTAGLVQGASVVTRGTSTATTGGLGNPVVSTAELGGSVATAGIAVLVPLVAAVLVAVLLVVALWRLIRRWSRRQARV